MKTGEVYVIINKKRKYLYPVITAIISLILLCYAKHFQKEFCNLMDIGSYLAWHNLFELMDIVVGFSVFVVGYYTYDQTKDLRTLFGGSVFLTVSIIIAFHALSFKGMPNFFFESMNHANNSTTYWIISRIFLAVGMMIVFTLPQKTKAQPNKIWFAVFPVILSLTVFIVITKYPELLPAMYVEGQGLTPTKIILEHVVILVFLIALVRLWYKYRKSNNKLVYMIASAIVLNIMSEAAFISYVGVYDIYNYIGHLYKLLASFITFKVLFINSIHSPYGELSDTREQLKDYAENLDRLVEKRTLQLKKLNEKLMEDIEYARDVQKAMMPLILPNKNNIAFEAEYFPAERVSGDFYNIFKIDDQRVGFYIGDVSGHGVAAAMLTVFVRQSLMGSCIQGKDRANEADPASILKKLYKEFNNTNFKDEVYVVLLYGVYHCEDRLLTYASAGLNTSPLLFGIEREVTELDMMGFPICKFIEFHDAQYENTDLLLKRGDRILFHTDGLIEAVNAEGEEFSIERLIQLLKEHQNKPGNVLISSLKQELFDFMGNTPLKDDITYFLLEVG